MIRLLLSLFRKPRLTDVPAYRTLTLRIIAARKAHKPTAHLVRARTQLIHDALRRAA